VISCRHLSKVFRPYGRPYGRKPGGRVVALDDIDLQVDEGDFLAVVGPSGSGKTTLLTILGGLIRQTAGEVIVSGTPLAELPTSHRAAFRARTIGFVFQLFHLVPYLTALENVLLAGYVLPSPDVGNQERAEELLAAMGLGDRLDHTPGELSAGEKQRVALARALFNDPPILLADEPTGNLDPERSHDVLDHLKRIHEAGKTVVLVTHSPELAQVAQRAVTLRAGKLTED